MRASRINKKQPGKTKSSQNRNSLRSDLALDRSTVLVDTICCLAGDEHLIGNRKSAEINRLRRAIEQRGDPRRRQTIPELRGRRALARHAGELKLKIIRVAQKYRLSVTVVDGIRDFKTAAHKIGFLYL